MRGMRIGTRLALGFGLVILVLASLVGLILFHLGEAENRMTLVLQDRYRKVELTNAMKQNAIQMQRKVRDAMLAPDRAGVERSQAALSTLRRNNEAMYATFLTMRNRAPGIAILNAIKGAAALQAGAEDQLFVLLASGNRDGARTWFNDEVLRSEHAYTGALDAMAARQDTKMYQEFVTSRAELDEARVLLFVVFGFGVVFAGGVAYYATRSVTTPLREINEDLRASRDRLHEVLAHQDRVKEDERKRIAREIHDELGGLLTGIKSYLSFATDKAERSEAAPDRHLMQATELADNAIDTVRRVITDLRPSVLDQFGLCAAIEWHAGQMAARTGLACVVKVDPGAAEQDIGPQLGIHLFRIVQEGLTNVVRHAEASWVRIDVACVDGMLVITMADNGKGIEPARLINQASWGITGMYERARYLGGALKIAPAAEGGTVLDLRIPLKQDEHEHSATATAG